MVKSTYAATPKNNSNTHPHYLRSITNGRPNIQHRTHNISNIHMTVSNWGYLGASYYSGNFVHEEHPSCEYPAYSDITHLNFGALWIGAIVDDDTLVSVGADGWYWVNELYPDAYPKGEIEACSNLQTDSTFHPDAISEQDFIATYTDTLDDPIFVQDDPIDSRDHIPLNVKIVQKSYCWSQKYAEDFILFDFVVHNIGSITLKRAYIGFFMEADIWHLFDSPGFNDDICGFKETVPAGYGRFKDTIHLAWAADNDGDPNGDYYNQTSPVAATGIRLISSSNPHAKVSFNWWAPYLYGMEPGFWGPVNEKWGWGKPIHPCLYSPPRGDRCKYYWMSRGEIDYDQIYTAIDYTDQGWFPPPPSDNAKDIANGQDLRYLYSFGAFDINPGDSAWFTVAIVGGDNLHDRPNDFRYKFDPEEPDRFYESLDFSDLAGNAKWAGWIYDNPGVDTDGDGNFGCYHLFEDTATGTIDTMYYAGDGIPDYSGPPSPPPPELRFKTAMGRITVRWNGLETETHRDPFSNYRDFEGYRVYVAKSLEKNDFALVISCDLIDFWRYTWDPGKNKWLLKDNRFTLDSLKTLYGQAFDPLAFTETNPFPAVDGNIYCFKKIDWNCAPSNDVNMIGKVCADEIYPSGNVTSDTGLALYPQNYFEEDGKYYHKYYEYEYTLDNLKPTQALHIAVTAFDCGYYQNRSGQTESSPLTNAAIAYPVYPADSVRANDLHASVYPNPYRIDGAFPGIDDWEKVYFINLPGECVIKIWTQDGDLARTIHHYPSGPCSQTDSKAYWDIRNDENVKVVSGIYIYTIESKTDSQTGKLVVIK